MAKTLEERVAALELKCTSEHRNQTSEAMALMAFAEAVTLELAQHEPNPAAFVRGFIGCVHDRVETLRRPDLGDQAWFDAYLESAHDSVDGLARTLQEALKPRSVPPPGTDG